MMKIHNNRELQNIATNHSADIDYKNFMKIYRNCTSESYSFLTIDTTLPAKGDIQMKFAGVLTALEKYKPTKPEYIDEKLKVLDNAGRFYNGREMIINAFKNEIFPFYHEKINLKMKINQTINLSGNILIV